MGDKLGPMSRHRVIDADFEVVSGPYRVGDEHPTERGWYFTDKVDRRGNPLWYRPPSGVSRWVRRVALTLFLLMMAGAIVSVFFERPTTEADREDARRILEATDPDRPLPPTEPLADAAAHP